MSDQNQTQPESAQTVPAEAPAIQPAPQPQPAPEKKGSIVVKAGRNFAPLVPTTMQEAWLFCQRMAMSYNLPEAFYKKPKDSPEGLDIIEVATARALHALQLGMEAGLPPAQSIQSVLVLNGIGTLWGDSQLALVINSGEAEYVKEYTTGGDMWLEYDATNRDRCIPNPDYTWVCETKRVGKDAPIPTKFSIRDAIHAGLWGKKTWATHPDRMGMYKARAFCLRDNYADVLKGLTHSREEMEGEIIDVTPSPANEITPSNPAARLSQLLNKNDGAAVEKEVAAQNGQAAKAHLNELPKAGNPPIQQPKPESSAEVSVIPAFLRNQQQPEIAA